MLGLLVEIIYFRGLNKLKIKKIMLIRLMCGQCSVFLDKNPPPNCPRCNVKLDGLDNFPSPSTIPSGTLEDYSHFR